MSVVRSKLSKDIRQWVADKGIIENSNLKKEFLKVGMMISRLSMISISGNKGYIKEFIGEVYISITTMLEIEGIHIEDLEPTQNEFYEDSKNRANAIYWIINSIGDISKYIIRNKKDKFVNKIRDLIDDLNALAIHYGTNLDECVLEVYKNKKANEEWNKKFIGKDEK